MRSLKALLSRSGAVLFGLDLLLLVPTWPMLLWSVGPQAWAGLLLDPLLLAYPLAQLSLLYAMGLYRRDAILSTRRTLIRLPLVVGLAVQGAHVVQMIAGGAVDAANVSAAAMLGFAASAAIARVGLFMLLRGGVFRRRSRVKSRFFAAGACGRRCWTPMPGWARRK